MKVNHQNIAGFEWGSSQYGRGKSCFKVSQGAIDGIKCAFAKNGEIIQAIIMEGSKIMTKFIIVTLLLSVAFAQQAATISAQQLKLVGAADPYTNLTSLQFQKVLSFIKQQRPQLSSYVLSTVLTQLVNGINYIVNFKLGDTCTAQVIVYSTFAGQLSISSYISSLCPGVIPAPKPDIPSTVIQPPTLGGYTLLLNSSGAEFEYALSKALQQTTFSRNDLVMTEVQTVNGKNYRFTFKNKDGSLATFIQYVPIDFKVDSYTPSSQYTQTDIQNILNDSLTLHRSELAGYQLVSTSSIWPTGQGLKFTFRKGEDFKRVFVYVFKGTVRNLIF